ncbi:hypothetical protein EGW08_022536 [Elysia chlorotica]|uniref:Tetraspanin n=1 Tax=Elysia chlorotica TaxID=188477 RepID=A0A433SKP6_ELYCH|nr:hypothetical protein EGW08_022536 [Elysia chlorotica]
MVIVRDREFIHKPYNILFLGLNSAIVMSTSFMDEIKIEMLKNLHRIIDGSNLLILRPTSIAITWYKDPADISNHFHWTNKISSLLIVQEVFVILAAVIAFVSLPFHRGYVVFTLYCLSLCAGMTLQVFFISSILEPSSRLYATMVRSAVSELENKYKLLTNSTYVSTVNSYMINARCCGVIGPHDFLHVNLSFSKTNFLFPYNPYRGADLYFPPGVVSYSFKFPPACCHSYLFNGGSKENAFRSVAMCAQGKNMTQLNWKGCLKRTEEFVGKKREFLIDVVTVMFILEMVCLTMGVYLPFAERRRYEDMIENEKDL